MSLFLNNQIFLHKCNDAHNIGGDGKKKIELQKVNKYGFKQLTLDD